MRKKLLRILGQLSLRLSSSGSGMSIDTLKSNTLLSGKASSMTKGNNGSYAESWNSTHSEER
jgi:hypothetical protein